MRFDFSIGGNTCCATNKEKLDATVSQSDIKKVYDKIAPIYDIWGNMTEAHARKRALELAEIKDGKNILEVAVGTGLAFYEIVKRNPNGTNTGVDLSQGMLEKAKKRLDRLPQSNYSLSVGTAFQLEIPDDSIDTLMNNYMFDLITYSDMDRVLAEFKRVLKKEGKLVLVNMTEGESFGSRLYDLLYKFSPKMMGGCRGIKLSDKLRKNGFRVASRKYIQQMLFPSEVILAYKI